MYIRAKNGNIILIKPDDFANEKDLYKNMWKNKFNIKLDEVKTSKKDSIIDYVNGISDLI